MARTSFFFLTAFLATSSVAAPASNDFTPLTKLAPTFDLFPPPGLSVLTSDFLAANPVVPNGGPRTWTDGRIPEYCRNEAQNRGINPHDMDIFEATYSDCSLRWVFCRAKAATDAWSMIDALGRLPVRLRGRVRYLMAFTGGDSAFASNNNIVLFGNTATITVIHHEAAHCLDTTFGGQLNARAEYTAAKGADSCFPDNYARSSDAENWAQTFVIHRFQRTTGKTGPRDTSCLQNQLRVIGQQTDAYLDPNQCDLGQRVPDGRILNPGEW